MPELDKELSRRELDAAVAERVMGWRTSTISANVWHSETEHDSFHKEKFRPSESIEAAMQVENRIAELRLEARYVLELAKLVDPRGSRDDKIMSLWWALVHATAEQRCRAALAAIRSKPE